jgi:hypothetical protein
MKREPISSSTIAELGYDETSQVLEIMFNNGRLYQYFEIPRAVFEEFRNSGSVGQYFNSQVRDRYRYARL